MGGGSKEVSDPLTGSASLGVPATSQEFPKWRSRHQPPSRLGATPQSLRPPPPPPPPPRASPLPPRPAPLVRRGILLSNTLPPSNGLRCRLLVVCPFRRPLRAGMGPLLSLDGESERSHVPRAAERRAFNWDVRYTRVPRGVYRENWDAAEFLATRGRNESEIDDRLSVRFRVNS